MLLVLGKRIFVIVEAAMKKSVYVLCVSIILFSLFVAGCAATRSEPPHLAPTSGGAAKPAEAEMDASSSDLPQVAERIVIKNAEILIVVSDPVKTMDAINRKAEDLGGYVVSSNQYQTELESGAKVPRATTTIRVPADKLNDVLADIRKMSERPALSETINSQDVTKEYTDLQSRLRNLEAAETQLSKIMDSATKTEDVMAVYNQLVDVREKIEVIKGQIKYYDQSAALSAVSVDLVANEAVQPLTIGGWQPVGVAKSALQALINTLKFLANLVIWIIIFLAPILLVIYIVFILPLSFIWRRWRARRGKDGKSNTPLPPGPPAAPDQPAA